MLASLEALQQKHAQVKRLLPGNIYVLGLRILKSIATT